MAQRMTLAPHVSVKDLHQRYREAVDPVARSQWQMLWLLTKATPTTQVAQMTGYTVRWVQEVARRYRAGPAAIGDRRHGNPGAAPLLAAAQQETLREALGGPAPDGGIWTGRTVAAWMSEQLGRPVDAVRGWEWMRRLGFTPQRPRPRETRADAELQAAFTKGGSPPRLPR